MQLVGYMIIAYKERSSFLKLCSSLKIKDLNLKKNKSSKNDCSPKSTPSSKGVGCEM